MVSVRPTFLIGSTLIFVAFCGSDILNRSTKVVAAVMSRIFFGQSRSLPWHHWMDCYSTVKHCGMRRMTRLVLVASLCLFFGGRLRICAMVKRWIICLYLNILYILSMYLIYNMYNTYIYIMILYDYVCIHQSIIYIEICITHFESTTTWLPWSASSSWGADFHQPPCGLVHRGRGLGSADQPWMSWDSWRLT